MEQAEIQKIITEIIQKITGFMHVQCQVDFREEPNAKGKTLIASLNAGEDARILIGHNGENLRALEQIVRLLFFRYSEGTPQSITLDINDYRKIQAAHIVELARQAVSRVRSTGKAEALPPMSAYERRVVHMELAAHPDITTESIGEDPQRRVVIKTFL